LAACALSLTLGVRAHAAEPTATATYGPREVRAEFDELYERLQASHYDLYARRPKPDFDARHRSQRRTFDRPLTRFEIQKQFQDFVAYGNVAHASIAFPADDFEAYRAGGGAVFPLFVRIVHGAARVSTNYSGLDAIAVGDEIVALDGHPFATWVPRLTAHLSADSAYLAHAMLETQLPALMWLERGPVARFNLELRNARGETYELVVPARSRDEMRTAARQQTPVHELAWDRRDARVLDGGIAYLRPGPFYNHEPGANSWDVSAFSAFIDAAFRRFIDAGAKRLIVDLRDNPGGDNSFSDLMVRWFAHEPFRFASSFRIKTSRAAIDSNRKRLDPKATDSISHKLAQAYAARKLGEVFAFEIPWVQPRAGTRFDGKVYLLVNRHSYSNTVMVAALAQDFGFATILGEETADLATTFGAAEQFELSRTGISVSFPKAHIVRPSGANEARGVVPDITIDTPIAATAEDVVLARAIALAAKDER
jgi:C-terminal processing protease CtpA/Prc